MITKLPRSTALAVAMFLLLSAPAAVAAAAEVLIVGPKGERKLTPADLQALPQVEVVLSDHGKQAKFSGVLLFPLLEQVGAPGDDAFRGKELTKYVMIEAADGYRAVFSLAELSPAFTDRKVILATHRDGTALPADEGPFRIAVQDEKKMARSVRQVTVIRLLDAK